MIEREDRLVYTEASFLPVAAQVAWERAPFLSGAERLAARFGYPEWKTAEIASTLEMIFDVEVAAGKNYQDAMEMVENAIRTAELTTFS